jgi:hypothetical protein
MLMGIATVALALQLGAQVTLPLAEPQLHEIQYRVPVHPPPCGHGWDLSARDGMCYPNGYLAPQDQAARQRYYRPDYNPGYGERYYGGGYRGGRYPVPCDHGADLDIRDGLCYPTGTVPLQFQQGRRLYRY